MKTGTLVRTLAVGTLVVGTSVHASVVQALRSGVCPALATTGAGRVPADPASPAGPPGRALHGGKTTFNAETDEWNQRSLRARGSNAVFLQAAAPQAPAIRTGGTLFRERCADCHGAEAKGDRGPDLTGLWTSEAADNRAFQIIRSGVAGSIMPPSQAPDEEIRAIVAYLRSISTTTAGPGSRGNAANGERIFWTSCGGCHHVEGRGGRLGPDLSRIASTQSREALMRSIRDANASITSGYEPVTLVTRDGQRIRGLRKGEDAFSIQIMDTRQRLQGYVKAELRDASRDTQSLMPSFAADRLSDADLGDLLDFLGTLRSDATSRGGRQ